MASLISAYISMLQKAPQLSDSTFQSWKNGLTMFFAGVGADYLTSSPLPATVPTECKDLDKKLVMPIWSSIQPELQYLVEGKTSSLACMAAIQAHFQKSTMPRRIQAREAFYSIKHDPSKPISVYLHEVESAKQVLSNLGCKIDDTELKDVILMNLHSSWHTIRTSILTAKEEPDLADIKSILSGSAASAIQVQVKTEPSASAMAAKIHSPRPSYPSSKPSTNRPPSPSPRPPSPPSPMDTKGFRWCTPSREDCCFRCGKHGHPAWRCMYDMPQQVKDWVLQTFSKGSGSAQANIVHMDTGDPAHGLPLSIFPGTSFVHDPPSSQIPHLI